MGIKFIDKSLGNVLLLTTGEPLLLEDGDFSYLLLFGAESALTIRLPQGIGKGLIWDQFGREQQNSVVLFPQTDGSAITLRGTRIRLGYRELEARQYELTVASGGSAFLSTQQIEIEGYSISAASGGSVFLEYAALEISQYSLAVFTEDFLLLNNDTLLLLTDGSGLFLEV